MYINSKHLQILKVIKNNQVSNIKEISDIFSISQQHTKLYLEDIYSELFLETPKDLKGEVTIEKIRTFPNSKNILKQCQQFTKNQKIFYLIFNLIKNKQIKLSHICEDLNLTKRNLNNYLDEISKIITPYNLKIKVTNKGLILTCTPYSLKRFKYLLIFKFLVEREFLPTQFRKEFMNFIKIDNFYKMKKDIANFVQLINCRSGDYCEISLYCFFITYHVEENEKQVKDITYQEILKYKPGYYNTEFFYKTLNFIKNSSFNSISSSSLNNFFDLLDIFKYSRSHFEKNICKKSEEIRPIFAKYIGNHIYENKDFSNIVNPWVQYSYLKDLFFIDDYTFLNFNLNYLPNSNIYEMTKEINAILPRFTLFESIFIWYYFSKTDSNNVNNVFVFKNLPSLIIPILIEEIYKKHNIKISNYVNILNFNEYKKSNKIDRIITVENITIYNNEIPIKNLFFPIPNYKSSFNLKIKEKEKD